MKGIIISFVILLLPSFLFAKDNNALFFYEHTKGQSCGESWLLMENLIQKEKVRCKGLLTLDGFPYLRGPKSLVALSKDISTKYSEHEWLELLRRSDLQARYIELDALSKKAKKEFCSKANIDCFWGRIRAYVARCSAILMGDEKLNHDYMKRVKESAKKALSKSAIGNLACFQDIDSLDGLLGEDVVSRIFTPHKTNTGASILKRRVESMKALGPKGYK